MSEATVRFRASVKKHVKDMKSSVGHNGAWFSNVNRIIRASHPMHWLVCAGCEGDGKNHEGDLKGVCPRCFGSGYKLRLED
jgi:hypothetical protein